MEKKANELLLMESILRYTSADDSDPAQPFTNPLLDGTSLLRPMDRAQLCPPPPTLDSNTDAIDACECGRWEGGAVATQPANPQFSPGCPANPPLLPVHPSQSQPACPTPPGI